MSINDERYKRKYDEKWNFKGGSMKALVHGLHPYPAMMMPLIARTMLEEYGKGKETVFLDPYVGSGTTIVEAQYYGVKRAIGVDLNPLAILITRTKTQDIDLGIKVWLRNIFVLFVMSIIMIWVNGALKSYDTNFWFVVRPPQDGLPLLNLDNGWYVYYLTLLGIGLISATLVHFPFMLKEMKNKPQ